MSRLNVFVALGRLEPPSDPEDQKKQRTGGFDAVAEKRVVHKSKQQEEGAPYCNQESGKKCAFLKYNRRFSRKRHAAQSTLGGDELRRRARREHTPPANRPATAWAATGGSGSLPCSSGTRTVAWAAKMAPYTRLVPSTEGDRR